MQYNFYYDESEHSREIGFETVTAKNFYDNFLAVIVGWQDRYESNLETKYLAFENKYEYRKSKGELKSHSIKNTQLKFGFASLSKDNIKFIDDFLSLFTKEVYFYFSSISKVEYIVDQLFENYHNSMFADMDAFKYTITKALVINRPKELIDCIYHAPDSMLQALKKFFEKKIEIDQKNPELKEIEIRAFQQILLFLNDIQVPRELKWDYHPPFEGFQLFLKEHSIKDYTLTIDHEGELQKTLHAAQEAGLKNVNELDSTEHFAIRMADMLAGLLSKLMKAICRDIHPADSNDLKKTILPVEWFKLNSEQLKLYKKLYYIICELNVSWYKSYAGRYSDDLICLVALLGFMNQFANIEEIQNNIKMQGEYFNSYICQCLSDYYDRQRNKLPFEPISITNVDYFINQRGAKVFLDINKQPLLNIKEGKNIYCVLSVGFNKEMVPLVTISESGKVACYRLPADFLDWAIDVVGLANMGEKLFPAKVFFTKSGTEYCAEIL